MRLASLCLTGLAVLTACQTPSAKPVTPVASTSASAPAGNPQAALIDTTLRAIAAGVSESSQRAYIERMVSFGTRHTLSDTVSDTRGIGAARRWVGAEFQAMGAACGGCLEIATPSGVFSAPRIPTPTPVGIVMAIQKGTTDPNRVIIISGHLDSRVSDALDATSESPGANDDASGTAAVMEAARVLTKYRFDATLVYAALTGEEQGLYGGKVLADYAKARGWKVEAVLNNDIVGNIHGSSGVIADKHVRIFTEGVRSLETQQMAAARMSNGGEVDSPSRNLARYIDLIAERHLDGFDAAMIYRRDRFGRGGDQVRMLEAGFPSVRITEAAENYTRQHQDLRTENGVVYGDTIDGVDFPYLARVTRLNVMTMAALATAPPPPTEVKIEGAVSPDTKVSWTAVPGAAGYAVWWRGTTEPVWTSSRTVAATETSVTLPGIVIDDWFFGVSTIGPDGYASPVQYSGIVGAFFPPATD